MSNFLTRLLGITDTKGTQPDFSSMNRDQNGPFRFIGGQLIPYKQDKLNYLEKGYAMNGLVNSVVSIILNKAVQAPGAMYVIKDEQKFFQYSALKQKMSGGNFVKGDYKKLYDLRAKSLMLDTSDEYMNELFMFPNENETFRELNYGLWCYKLVTGDYFEAGWTPYTSGFNKGKPMQLYGLPSQYMSILAGNTMPITETGYELALGTILPYTKEDVVHEKYFNPFWDVQGRQLYGMSPLQAELQRVQRNNLLVKRGAIVAENAGADVVVYNDDPSLTASVEGQKFAIAQMQANKKTWDREQGGYANAGKAIWSAYKLNSTRLTLSPVEMDAIPTEWLDLRMIANIYGVPSQLLNDPENKIYNNMSEGEKALITRCCMPLQVARQATMNRKLRTLSAFKGKNKVFEFDQTVYSELEEDKQELATWTSLVPMPLWYRYDLMGLEVPSTLTEEEKNAVIMPTGQQLLSDLLITDTETDEDVAPEDDPYQQPENNSEE